MEMEAMVDHSEVYPQETEFKIVEVFSVDNPHYGASNSVTEVVIEEESDSDILVVDHDFGYGASQGLNSDAEIHSSGQSVKRRRRRQPETLFCPVCGKMCMSISGLKVHQKVHLRDPSLDCNICNMTFPSQAAQSAHMAIHNPEKTHQCPCCPLRFASDRALQGHFRVHHKGFEMMLLKRKQEQQQQTPQSPPARKKSKQRSPSPPSGHFSESPPSEYFSPPPPPPPVSVKRKGKKKHKTPALLEMPHELPETPEPEILSLQLIDSQKGKSKGGSRNRDKIKMSKLNRKAFLQASPVQQASFLQQVIEESKKPVPALSATTKADRNGVYRCNICKKIFRELHFLEKHIVVHMAVRLHKCNTCGESFDSARGLNAHESEVHDQGQYVCSICGKNLHKLGSLLNHQLLHEKKGAKAKGKARSKLKK